MSRIVWISIITCIISLGQSARSFAEDEFKAKEQKERIKYLIEMLASKNQAPMIQGDASKGDDEEIVFSKDYDPALQVPVYLAAQQLLAEGEAAIEPLLAHTGDKRYSISVNSYRDSNRSVSDVCEGIAYQILFPMYEDLERITRSPTGDYPNLKKHDNSLLAWWKANKRRGLRAIQIEAIDAKIAGYEKLDAESALPLSPRDEPLSIREFNQGRDKNIRLLKSIRRSIQEGNAYRSRKAYGDDPYRCIFGLPWSIRRFNI